MPSKEGSKISPFSSIVLAFFKMYDGEMKGKNAKLQAHELLKFEQSQLFIIQNNSKTEQRLPLHQAQESHFGWNFDATLFHTGMKQVGSCIGEEENN